MPRRSKPLSLDDDTTITPELAFALVVREHRLRLGLSQYDLEGDGVDRSYVSKLELGKRQIGLRGFIHLAKKLQMTPAQLMEKVMQRIEGE